MMVVRVLWFGCGGGGGGGSVVFVCLFVFILFCFVFFSSSFFEWGRSFKGRMEARGYENEEYWRTRLSIYSVQ